MAAVIYNNFNYTALVVILKINVARVFAFEHESQPPVTADRDTPRPFSRALQLVQAVAR